MDHIVDYELRQELVRKMNRKQYKQAMRWLRICRNHMDKLNTHSIRYNLMIYGVTGEHMNLLPRRTRRSRKGDKHGHAQIRNLQRKLGKYEKALQEINRPCATCPALGANCKKESGNISVCYEQKMIAKKALKED